MYYQDSEGLKRLGEFKQLAPTEFSVDFDKTLGGTVALSPESTAN